MVESEAEFDHSREQEEGEGNQDRELNKCDTGLVTPTRPIRASHRTGSIRIAFVWASDQPAPSNPGPPPIRPNIELSGVCHG